MLASVSSAEQLLPRDLQQPYTSGEVLELEFKLIHGETAWDPEGRKEDEGRGRYVEQAKAHLPDLPANATDEQRQKAEEEATRLALHAWSVRNLPNTGQAALCLSGGGIRSAAFALGILQGLARRNLL